MIPYGLYHSSVYSANNDFDYTEKSFLPINTDAFGFEFFYSTGNSDHCENEYALDLFTFLLDKDDIVFNDQLYFYGNGGSKDSPVIARELVNSIWGYPVESDAFYFYMSKVPEEVKTIMFAGFLYDAAARNQKLQDLEFIRVRLFTMDNHNEDGKTVLQYTITPDMFGTDKCNIMVFLSLVHNKDGWKLIKHNMPICIDPIQFVEKYRVPGK